MPAPPLPARRLDGSMSLLVDLMRDAQDPAYAEAAAGRSSPATAVRRHRPARRVLGGALLVGVVGLVTGTAAATVRATSADADSVARGALVQEVRKRTAESDELTARAEGLRAEVTRQREAALARDSNQQAGRLRQLELAAATIAVTGPGVVATLDDRPSGSDTSGGLPRGGQVGSGRVLDRDLQELVNGLWAAGAEAVSVNDLRLTTRTAIRSAGEAILVDYRPLSPPYVVRAIGDPNGLQATFADSAAGRRLSTYTSLYGLRLDLHGEQSLALPAGTVAALRAAIAGSS